MPSEFREQKAERGLARRLRIPVGDPVIAFTRLRLADERTTVPGSYVLGLSAGDLEGSMYELLVQRYGIELVSGTSTLEPTMPDSRTAEWPEISTSQPCLLASGVSFDDRQRVFETPPPSIEATGTPSPPNSG